MKSKNQDKKNSNSFLLSFYTVECKDILEKDKKNNLLKATEFKCSPNTYLEKHSCKVDDFHKGSH